MWHKEFNADIQRFIAASEAVRDQCCPAVPTAPILELAKAVSALGEYEGDDYELAVVYDIATEVLSSYQFYPQTDCGSTEIIIDGFCWAALKEALHEFTDAQRTD